MRQRKDIKYRAHFPYKRIALFLPLAKETSRRADRQRANNDVVTKKEGLTKDDKPLKASIVIIHR